MKVRSSKVNRKVLSGIYSVDEIGKVFDQTFLYYFAWNFEFLNFYAIQGKILVHESFNDRAIDYFVAEVVLDCIRNRKDTRK